MAVNRRDALLIAGAGVAAALAGGIGAALFVQTETGAAELLAARYRDLEGHERRLLDWQGKVLLCNFWATWCAPCREEVPLLLAARREWAGNGLEIVGIGVDSADKMRQFAQNFGITYPLLIADGTTPALMRRIGNPSGGLPYTVALDRQGRIAHRHLGALTEGELRRVLASLFG